MDCPKCKGSMDEGYFLDRQQGARKVPSEWVEGEPDRMFLIGVSINGKDHREIQVFRCSSCGFLESYAK